MLRDTCYRGKGDRKHGKRLKAGEGDMEENCIPGREKDRCKDPPVGTCLPCLRTCKEANAADGRKQVTD